MNVWYRNRSRLIPSWLYSCSFCLRELLLVSLIVMYSFWHWHVSLRKTFSDSMQNSNNNWQKWMSMPAKIGPFASDDRTGPLFGETNQLVGTDQLKRSCCVSHRVVIECCVLLVDEKSMTGRLNLLHFRFLENLFLSAITVFLIIRTRCRSDRQTSHTLHFAVAINCN